MDMDLRQIRMFVKVAEYGSITKAASALHMEQPPLSRNISHLEKRLGLTLFSRSHTGVTLTTTGRDIYAKSVDVLRNHEEFSAYTKRLSTSRSSYINIGLSDGMSANKKVISNINLFLRNNPTCKYTLFGGSQDTIVTRVLRGDIDCAVIWGQVRNMELSCIKYSRTRIYAAVNDDLFRRNCLYTDINTLMRENIIFYGGGEEAHMFKSIHEQFDGKAVASDVTMAARDIFSAITLVSLGLGCTIVPSEIITLPFDNVMYIPINGDDINCEVSIIYRKIDDIVPLKNFLAAFGLKK
ncbi:LysR family transcriptional regulator [Asaia sp. BMEF1]|uniref:LysR family transcriptional regulator n=1 Tax=Asaia sp. BMEF1 TaxID=3155932 RepID=UPI003F679872